MKNLHQSSLLLAGLAGIAVSACSGELVLTDPNGSAVAGSGADAGTTPGDEQDQGTPTALFSAEVQPILRAKCTACHETGGIGPVLFGEVGPDDDYDATVADAALHGGFQAASATLLTKGAHSGVVWWTPAQSDTITGWLEAESAER